MPSLAESYRKEKTLHHAYLVSGEREAAVQELLAFLKEKAKLKVEGNPDVAVFRYETLGIDEARDLRALASRKSFSAGKKIFIVAAHFMTREAQNALLKLLEEPTADTHFFIVTEHGATLLPTLRSRLSEVAEGSETVPEEALAAARHFAALSPAERLEAPEAKALIEEKDKQGMSLFLDALTFVFRARGGNDLVASRKALEALLSAKRFVKDRSASVKLLLEHLALTLPTIK
ncbi:MAG: hypothetical protein Q8Q36_01335 [bacterium]|nr:hypothetical protein [bacterium]